MIVKRKKSFAEMESLKKDAEVATERHTQDRKISPAHVSD